MSAPAWAADKRLRDAWLPWFAWRPVLLIDSRMAWMTMVERRYCEALDQVEYRASDMLDS
jgi:hypothetical protein